MKIFKAFAKFFLLVIVFFGGYFFSIIKTEDEIKKEIYGVASSSFLSSATMSVLFLDISEIENLDYGLLRKCTFASFYNDYNNFIGWMEKDRPLFWSGTHYFDRVESYRRVAVKEFGSENLKEFYNEKCYPLFLPAAK